jgi:hypothetical protein
MAASANEYLISAVVSDIKQQSPRDYCGKSWSLHNFHSKTISLCNSRMKRIVLQIRMTQKIKESAESVFLF